MTLARAIYKCMEVGKPYTIEEIMDMLYKAERAYLDTMPEVEEALEQEWLEAVESAYFKQKALEALKVTRKFGYTTVHVEVREAYDFHADLKGKYGKTYHRVYHYGEHKDFTYIRVK